MPATPSLPGFLARLVLWLPLCYLPWFASAPLLHPFMATATHLAATHLLPNGIHAIEADQQGLLTTTRFPAPGDQGTRQYRLDPRTYGYGLPLFLALCLSSPGPWRRRLLRAGAGALILLALQTWAVYIDILKTVVLDMAPGAAQRTPPGSGLRETLVLSYQFAGLVLPNVTPPLLWAALHGRLLLALTLRNELKP